MPRTAALCCYKNRAVVSYRCALCRTEYACPEFGTKAALLKFNALIPPSMLLSPLPIELWPNMCAEILPGKSVQPTRCASNEPGESPARRFVSAALGLPIDQDPDST
jgi:hypothetical protein